MKRFYSVKAHEGECAFRLSDQNYRFQFNDALVYNSAFIEQELDVSGHIESPTGDSFYQEHTLVGSLDSIVSYNIEFMSGEGLLVEADEWTNVGQLGFDIADIADEVKLIYMDEDMFPPTYVGEFYDQTRMTASEGDFTVLAINLRDFCDAENITNVINLEIENYKGASFSIGKQDKTQTLQIVLTYLPYQAACIFYK